MMEAGGSDAEMGELIARYRNRVVCPMNRDRSLVVVSKILFICYSKSKFTDCLNLGFLKSLLTTVGNGG